MKNKYLRTFFAESDDAAGGGVEELLETPIEEVVEEVPTPESTVPVIPTVTMTAADIAAAVKSAFPQQQQEPQKPQLTQVEIDKLLKKFEVDDGFIEKFDNLATRKAAMNELVTKIADHAEARAQVHTYGEVQRIQQTFAPQMQAFQEWQAQQREARFNDKFKELSKPELKPVVAAAAAAVFARQKFDGEEPAFDAVAREAERIIQTHAPGFKLSAKSTRSSNPNELPTVSAGGGARGGDQPSAPRKGPRGVELFAD